MSSASKPTERRRENDTRNRDQREFEVSVEHKQNAEDENQRQREHDIDLRARRRVFFELTAPPRTVANWHLDLLVYSGACFRNGTREVAAFD